MNVLIQSLSGLKLEYLSYLSKSELSCIY